MNTQTNYLFAVSALAAAISLSACGGGGGGSGSGGGQSGSGSTGSGAATCTSSDTVQCALNNLGVDTRVSARRVNLDENSSETLTEDYAPLGSARTINKFGELLTLGFALDDATFGTTNPHAVSELVPGNNNSFRTDVLFAPPAVDTPWTANGFARAGTAADIDGDGRDEMLVVYRDVTRADTPVYLTWIDDHEDGNTISAPMLISNELAEEFEIESGDFDGDGDMEAAVGMMMEGSAVLLFLDNQDGNLVISGNIANPIHFSATTYTRYTIVFEVGNLDFDRAEEIAVSLNEYQTNFSFNNNDGVSHYAIFDDATADFAELASGNVSVDLPTDTLGAKGADVAVGDVDGDNVDEVVLGGLTAIGNECGLNAQYVLTVLDDAAHGLNALRAQAVPYQPVQGACESGSRRYLTYLHVNTADVDDDGAKEIQANELIFEDLREDAGNPGMSVAYAIDKEDLLWQAGSSSSGVFSWNSSSMAVGDVTSDEREDIVFYSQSDGGFLAAIRVWGLDQINGWSEIHTIPAEFNNSFNDQVRPMVVPANVNSDSLALRYSDGSYRLLFTEPMIVAALAAAPCSGDYGQNANDCRLRHFHFGAHGCLYLHHSLAPESRTGGRRDTGAYAARTHHHHGESRLLQ